MRNKRAFERLLIYKYSFYGYETDFRILLYTILISCLNEIKQIVHNKHKPLFV